MGIVSCGCEPLLSPQSHVDYGLSCHNHVHVSFPGESVRLLGDE